MCRRSMTEEPIPPEPGDDETVIVDPEPPDITIPPGGDATAQSTTFTAYEVSVIAERIEYLDEDGKLVTETLRDYPKKTLRKRFASLDAFLKRWNSTERKQAIIEELEKRRPVARTVGRGSGQGPRPVRPHLPCGLRPAAAHPARAGGKCPQARCLHQVRRASPRRAGSPASEIPGRRRHQPRRSAHLKISPFDAMGTPVELLKHVRRTAGFEKAVHELQSALYQESCLTACLSVTPSNPFKTSCARTAASMAMPSASPSSAGCSSSRSSTTRIRNSKRCRTATVRPSRNSSSGAPGPPTPKASPATRSGLRQRRTLSLAQGTARHRPGTAAAASCAMSSKTPTTT